MFRAFLVDQKVKSLPATQETWVQSLGQEHPLEKGMAAHSSILAWRSPWTEEPGGLKCMGSRRVGLDWATNTHTHTDYNKKIIKDLFHKQNKPGRNISDT